MAALNSPALSIGRTLRHAAVFNFKHWRDNTAMNPDSLLQSVAQLFALLEQRRIEYALVGGVALLQYVEGRNTEDLDLILAAPSLQQLPEIQIASQDADFARGTLADLKIDFLLTRNPLFDRVRQAHTTRQHFAEQEIACATVEGLLLLKLYALPSLYRQGNFARVGLYENDIATLLHTYQPPLEPLLAELARHLSETDLSAVRAVLADIQQRLARFGKESGQGKD